MSVEGWKKSWVRDRLREEIGKQVNTIRRNILERTQDVGISEFAQSQIINRQGIHRSVNPVFIYADLAVSQISQLSTQDLHIQSEVDYETLLSDPETVESIQIRSSSMNMFLRDKNKRTLLSAAASIGRADVIDAIFRSFEPDRAGINVTDHEGCTALHVAMEQSHYIVCQTLLLKGADYNLKNKDGDTIIHLLMRKKDDEQVSSLLRFICALPTRKHWDRQNRQGETALHLACQSGLEECVFILMWCGADPTRMTRRGETAEHYVEYSTTDRKDKILQLLREVKPEGQQATSISDVDLTKSSNLNLSRNDVPITISSIAHKKPILLVPGLCSSALEVWRSPWNKEGNMDWMRSRLWLSMAKLGGQKVTAHRSLHLTNYSKHGFNTWSSKTDGKIQQVRRRKRQELKGEGIKVRAVEGLHGIDFLSEDLLVRGATCVFSDLINNLTMHGYDSNSLSASTYDWRIPPSKLEERDNHLTKMILNIEMLRKLNGGRKVVLIAHSMGNRLVQYFLTWAEKNHGREWIDANIDTFVAVGAPWLGAPKTVRGAVTGEKFTLDLFLTDAEGQQLCRGVGTLPWMFPLRSSFVGRSHYAYIRSKESLTPGTRTVEDLKDQFEPHTIQDCFEKSGAASTWAVFEEHFKSDPLYWNLESKEDMEDEGDLPVLKNPPVNRLVCIHGINVRTECVFFFTRDKKNENMFMVDPTVNLEFEGLLVKGGIGYERRRTPQNLADTTGSGDGTVPYMSLNYPQIWKNGQVKEEIQIHTLENAEHRAILQDYRFFQLLYQYIM
ncbi:hypothetical protein PROFUN_02410 [Planoprotostelium fungivorum]|uniref:Uncharacterized protein n=1 Tax=Planoprotostelium fungivorum TaxID=1890364 RepID=A0A2P6NUW2_9EUKA|nr:hypothetical protein PROFUN_02410 [Planoprotostelium fungivorum]